jgi:hypothetical protein
MRGEIRFRSVVPIPSLREAGAPSYFRVGQFKLPGSLPEALGKQVHGNRMFPKLRTASMYIA